MSRTSTINPEEVAKFSALADQWWDPKGDFKPLHKFNPARIATIRDMVTKHLLGKKTYNEVKPFTGLSLLDIGCGGGLIAEPMCRLGAKVTAIDASEKNIGVASLHAKEMELAIDYRHQTVEELVNEKKQYDVVLCLEVVEHVDHVEEFLTHASNLVKKGGLLFAATLNRTFKSYVMAIIGAEYVMRWLPRGTHDWRKFLTPAEISNMLPHLTLQEATGFHYALLGDEWSRSKNLGVNYMMVFRG